jgi:hypothetical protein
LERASGFRVETALSRGTRAAKPRSGFGCCGLVHANLSLEPFSSLSVVTSVNGVKAKMKTPELSDLYRFFIDMHGDEAKARTDYERFMAGDLAPHILAYCRDRVEGEEREHVDQSEGN